MIWARTKSKINVSTKYGIDKAPYKLHYSTYAVYKHSCLPSCSTKVSNDRQTKGISNQLPANTAS